MDPYWQDVRKRFWSKWQGKLGFILIAFFAIIAFLAPLLASSKPIIVFYDHKLFFPLFRYLFFTHFFTKPIDLFFNLLLVSLPLGVILWWPLKKKSWVVAGLVHFFLFFVLMTGVVKDPARKTGDGKKRATWSEEVESLTDYGKLNVLLGQIRKERLHRVTISYLTEQGQLATLWSYDQAYLQRLKKAHEDDPSSFEKKERYDWMQSKLLWCHSEEQKIGFILWPLVRSSHWEEDVGGSLESNQKLPWWEVSRKNRKDLVAALIFGIRVSITVGFLAIAFSLIIGVPFGAIAGYFGGKWDVLLSRIIEIWESMPVFFTLLLIVAITGTKSIFLLIAIMGIFGWTGFSRYVRAEVLREKTLPYVESCQVMRFSWGRILFSHILPNAILPVIAIIPFAMMMAITSEAAISFLGLGEESSASWGILMDEARGAFPAESYLLWPPAIAISLLLIGIALAGDALRDAMDPRMRENKT